MARRVDPKKFQSRLLDWWKKNRRDFSWRRTRDPYLILVSEVLLHRTRANQVARVYDTLIKRYPTMQKLSNARAGELQRILRPLGLFWRTKLIREMANEVETKWKGEIPQLEEDLESLSGVSHYIAAAVRCFAFGESEALLDTNTVRILGRIFGIMTTDGSRRSIHFAALYKSLMSTFNPKEFNYAMIDLGALLCTPVNPKCSACPVNSMCTYGTSRVRASKQERLQSPLVTTGGVCAPVNQIHNPRVLTLNI